MTWTQTPTKWSNHFFENLFKFEWELTKSPAGAQQWQAKGAEATIPDAHDPSKKHVPTMLTTDLSLRFDPAYEKISRRFLEHPDQFADAFARAWFKLTHRDMGPIARYLGPLVPKEALIWQDPVPAVDHPLIDAADIAALKAKILGAGLSVSELVGAAWASASTFRGSDKRGGANGARIRLAPQKDWEVNQPAQLAKVLKALEAIQAEFNALAAGGKKVSLADLIVLGGARGGREGGEGRRRRRWRSPSPPGAWTPRRSRPTPTPSPRSSRAPTASATICSGRQQFMAPEEALVDRAQLLTLTAPEMTVLVGGLRVLGANAGGSKHGVFTKPARRADQRLLRQPARHARPSGSRPTPKASTKGRDRKTGAGQVDRHARRPDLRLALGAARAGRGLRLRRLQGEVRQGLRGGLDQGDGPRPLRPAGPQPRIAFSRPRPGAGGRLDLPARPAQ